MKKEIKFCILKNEFDDNHIYWIRSCDKYKYKYFVVDILSTYWLDHILDGKPQAILTCPSGRENLYKKLYDEKLSILDKQLGLLCYPSYNEVSIHENKKFLSYWLMANKLPHPKTFVFYNKLEAKEFANKTTTYPVVGKMDIGASGKGVNVFREATSLNNYIEEAFTRGLRQSWGPNLQMGEYKSRISKLIKDPARIIKKLRIYKKNFDALQKNFVILQEYVQHSYEWRVVKIGESYFAHQKIKQGDKASGTKGINYVSPPHHLLDFAMKICDKFKFNTMAIDVFEDGSGGYLINEMQCIFGHVQDYICAENGIPGRYVFNKGWQFEQGNFNTNLSYDLRLENLSGLIE